MKALSVRDLIILRTKLFNLFKRFFKVYEKNPKGEIYISIALYILLGFLIASIGVPLIESLQAVISALTELTISKINKGIAKSNLAIQAMAEEDEEPVGPKGVMGFTIPDDEDSEEEYEIED